MSAYCSALEGVAFHLPPNAMAQPVTVNKTSGAVAAAGSEGRQGATRPGAPLLGRLSAVRTPSIWAVSMGWVAVINSSDDGWVNAKWLSLG